MTSTALRKTRLTITLSPDLVEEIDGSIRPGQSRSSVIETWLRSVARRRAHDSLAAETVAYYEALSEVDRAEDLAYARVAGRGLTARDLDTDEQRPAARPGRRR